MRHQDRRNHLAGKKKKCPNLTLVSAHHEQYEEYDEKINQIYEEYPDLLSCDTF